MGVVPDGGEAGRDRPRPGPRHALAPREPVDGRARVLDDGAPGARERRLRGAARARCCARTAGSTTGATRSSRPRWTCCVARAGRWPTPSAARARPTSRRTTPGSGSWRSTSGSSRGVGARGSGGRGARGRVKLAFVIQRYGARGERRGGAALPLAGRAPGPPAPGRGVHHARPRLPRVAQPLPGRAPAS